MSRSVVGLICAAVVVSAALFLAFPDSTRDIEPDGLVYQDLTDLYTGIVLYAERKGGRVPALRIGNDVPEASFRSLVDAGLSSDALRRLNSRTWEYVVPEESVGKQLEAMGADEVLVMAETIGGVFHLDATGRAFKAHRAHD